MATLVLLEEDKKSPQKLYRQWHAVSALFRHLVVLRSKRKLNANYLFGPGSGKFSGCIGGGSVTTIFSEAAAAFATDIHFHLGSAVLTEIKATDVN